MFIHPTRTQLAEIGKRLNLPTIPPEPFLSALIDVYTEYPDVEYEDILRDIANCYLEYKDSGFIRRIINGDSAKPSDAIYGYLYYNDGNYETCVAIY
jgi:hypothetical protein